MELTKPEPITVESLEAARKEWDEKNVNSNSNPDPIPMYKSYGENGVSRFFIGTGKQ